MFVPFHDFASTMCFNWEWQEKKNTWMQVLILQEGQKRLGTDADIISMHFALREYVDFLKLHFPSLCYFEGWLNGGRRLGSGSLCLGSFIADFSAASILATIPKQSAS